MAFKIQNLSFQQLTKSAEVYLTAETGQFHQLIWFARMILVAENVSKDCGHVEAAIKSYKHPWRCDLIFQRQHAFCCIPYIVYVVGKIVICNRMMITIFELI
jgi:hypothetical protein